METVVILFRHGEVFNPLNLVYGRIIPVKLSGKGVKQMEKLGRFLRSKEIVPHAVYSSHLERAIKSAQAVLKAFSNPPKIIVEKNLQDVDHGGIKDQTIDWLEESGGDLYNLPGFKGKIEDQERMAIRIINALRKIVQNHVGENIFVSCHGDPTAYALWRLRFPKKGFPSREKMKKTNYLEKGQAWKIIFDNVERLIGYELLSPD